MHHKGAETLIVTLNYSTYTFRFTVLIHFFFIYRFQTLFTYKESILFCSKFICLWFLLLLLLLETSSLSCALPLMIHNITGALLSMHPFSCPTRVSGIPILLHTLSILLLLPFSFNSNKTIFVKLMTQ